MVTDWTHCPYCGAKLEIGTTAGGKWRTCPKCRSFSWRIEPKYPRSFAYHDTEGLSTEQDAD